MLGKRELKKQKSVQERHLIIKQKLLRIFYNYTKKETGSERLIFIILYIELCWGVIFFCYLYPLF